LPSIHQYHIVIRFIHFNNPFISISIFATYFLHISKFSYQQKHHVFILHITFCYFYSICGSFVPFGRMSMLLDLVHVGHGVGWGFIPRWLFLVVLIFGLFLAISIINKYPYPYPYLGAYAISSVESVLPVLSFTCLCGCRDSCKYVVLTGGLLFDRGSVIRQLPLEALPPSKSTIFQVKPPEIPTHKRTPPTGIKTNPSHTLIVLFIKANICI